MKPFKAIFAFILVITIFVGKADARGDFSRSSGGKSTKAGRASGSDVKRSPMTSSKMERPSSRPANRPTTRPASPSVNKPVTRPATRPAPQPVQRPSVDRPAQRPDNQLPSTRPGDGTVTRPGGNGGAAAVRPGGNTDGNRPTINRPDNGNRPQTLPGMVTYPSKPSANRPSGNIKIDNSRNRGDVNINQVKRPNNLIGKTNGNWDNNKWGGNRGVWGNNNDINIKINNNYRNNNNFSYRPNYWGARPWWGASNCHHWHHGHWNYGWNSYHYHHHWYYDDDDDFASGFMWGIAVWSLGNMIYDMGYQSYRNPYPAPPVQFNDNKSSINYTQPVSMSAAATPPGDEAATELAETKSAAATEQSRTAFKQGDYVTALKSADEAIAYTPGDSTLHEYRSLILFALGRYSDAAGVLNPVLASGPGWGWETMIEFYQDSETYNQQMRKLEAYTTSAPNKADARFLLGYHYMVCGHTKEAYQEFAKASELQPADSISRQLRDLTKSSISDASDGSETPAVKPDLMTQAQLPGIWVSDRGQEGNISFALKADGTYTWTFVHQGKKTEMGGNYSINDKGLLVMATEDSQMIVELVRKDDKNMKFTIIGAPDGDPGLEFTKG